MKRIVVHGHNGIFSLFLLCLALACSLQIAASQARRCSGVIIDASSGEVLIQANIAIRGTGLGTISDLSGNFSLTIPLEAHFLLVSHVGYKSETVHLGKSDTLLVVRLISTDVLLQEVTIYSGAAEQSKQPEISSLSLQSKRIAEITCVMPDVLRSIQMLPGISANNEFSAKFNVRGGTYDENLVLVNGTQVYEPFHLKEAPNASMGIFNTEMMRRVTLVTGGFSAKYGDRLSSVLDIEYREGSKERLKGAVALSVTNVDGYIEGPLAGSGSFIVGARKSYFEYMMSAIGVAENIHPSFYDVQGVVSFPLSPSNKLLFQFIHAGDKYWLDPTAEQRGPSQYGGTYKGKSATFQEVWNSFDDEHAKYYSNLLDLQNNQLFSSAALLKTEISVYEQTEEEYGYHTDDFRRDIRQQQNYFYGSHQEQRSSNSLRIYTLEGKASLDFQLSPYYEINGGMNYQTIFYRQDLLDERIFDEIMNTESFPDTASTHKVENRIGEGNEKINASSYKFTGYIENILFALEDIVLNLGGRFDYFDFNREFTASPRISASYQISSETTLRAAWGIYTQSPIYRQLAYSVASDTNTRAQRAIHYILGIEHTIPFQAESPSSLKVKVEAYYKDYTNLISSSQSSSGRISYSHRNDAIGVTRGIDCYAVLSLPGFYGWISYSLLAARENLFTDKRADYPRYTDQRHTLALVADITLGGGWNFNTRFIYGSGYAYTPSVQQYNQKTKRFEWVQGEKNSDHLPAYERVDVRLNKAFQLWESQVQAFLDISNVFNAANIQSYRYRYNSNGSAYREEIKLWPLVPTLGIAIRFE
ncbi:MAG: TonB-dependent receptor [bacterium]